jgi:hypothetical protein
MAEIRLIFSGVGGVTKNLTRLLQTRDGIRIVGALSRNADYAGIDLGVHAGVEPLGVAISTDRHHVFAQDADLLLIATTSFLDEVAVDIYDGIDRGLNVVTTAEEAAYPWSTDELASVKIDGAARRRGVSVLGAGLNPGFIFDALFLTASGICWDVEKISFRRVVDVSGFSATVQRRLGLGYSPEEFDAGVANGTVRGHIGFPQSFNLAAKCLGRGLERIAKQFEPHIATGASSGTELAIEPGQTAGFTQRVTGFHDNDPWIEAEFVAHVDLPLLQLQAEDTIDIEGSNPVRLRLSPGCNPQLGTAGMLASCIPRVVQAAAGFLTVADLALPHCRLGANEETLPQG